LRRVIHFLAYHLILAREHSRTTRAAGFRLVVRPTVFHPCYFLSSEYFAEFISPLDLSGKRVLDVGTGSGILALAAARAGAAHVVAADINPNAARGRYSTLSYRVLPSILANRVTSPIAAGMQVQITAT
jgi:predicted nicotinamide N-methyase